MRFLKRGLVVLVGLSVCAAATGASAQAVGRMAQEGARPPEPYLVWMIRSLGLFGFLSLLTGLAVFVGACFVVYLARRPAVIASYLVFLPLPLIALVLTLPSYLVLAIGLFVRTLWPGEKP
jgi:hypothetical protein